MNGREWSVRTWSMPWLAAAAGALQVAVARPALLPGLVAVGLLAWIPVRREPWNPSSSLAWAMALPFGIWWAILAVDGRVGPVELAGIAAWYLILLALLQTLRGPDAGSWRCWNSLAATMLAGFRPDAFQVAILLVQCLAILAHLRLEAARSGASRMRISWSGGIALSALLSTVPLWIRVDIPSGMFEEWRPDHARKGFSSKLRLGEGFLFAGDPSDGEIVLRFWAKRPPDHFKGAVFDTYHRGAWSRSEAWSSPISSRNEQEFSVFCLVSDTLEAPLGWARSEVSTDGFLLVPSGSGCVGAVSDSVRMVGSGVWRLDGPGIERGWQWFAGETSRRVLDAERHVPTELGGLLDSLREEAGLNAPATTDSVMARIARMFARSFRYSLQVSDAKDRDPLRVFFGERRGFCEHFASAGALLARSAGVPARVATGYAFPSPLAGGWVARRANAHAWVEVFDSTRGWTTWDPTPESEAGRIVPSWWRLQADGLAMWTTRWWHVFRDGAWRSELESLVERSTSRVRSTDAIMVAVLGASAVGWWFWRRGKSGPRDTDEHRSSWRRRANRAENLLRRAGWVRIPGETIGEFLARLPPEAPVKAKKELVRYQARRWTES